MALTNSEILDMIDTAIEGLLSGQLQSYSIGGKSFNRLNLMDLWKLRKEVQAAANDEAYGYISLGVITNE